MHSDAFGRWIEDLEARHLAELTFPEVSRALRALSSAYVERRGKLAEGAALSGAGKRAAFALFYGPLHFLLVRHIVAQLQGAAAVPPLLIDLGCGTGAAATAWAAAVSHAAGPRIVAIDRHPWAVAEARLAYRAFGLRAVVQRDDIADARLAKGPAAIVAAFTLNEMSDAAREQIMSRLLERAAAGDRVLIVEPMAKFVAPWWDRWRRQFERAGGRADEWRVAADLPPLVAKLDRAAGLNHREITGRSLWSGGGSSS